MAYSSPSIESHVFKSTPDQQLEVDIYRSPTATKGCIAFLHGGALLLGSRKDLPNSVISFLLEKGWNVASLDYRLAPEHSLPEILEDVKDGLHFLRKRNPKDPLIVVGYSAGAYCRKREAINVKREASANKQKVFFRVLTT